VSQFPYLAVPALALALPLLSSCGEASGRARTSTMRDSAGIVIVESRAPAWREVERWRLGGQPLVTIGTFDGPAAYQLHRIVGAYRTADGGIVAVNGGTNEIRYYDSSGVFLRSTGVRGGGPGEFGVLHAGYLYNDSLFAYDVAQRRISVFDPQGSFVRSFALRPGAGIGLPTALGRFSDGSWVASRTNHGLETGFARGISTYSRVWEEPPRAVTIGTFAGPELIVQPVGTTGGAYTRAVPYGRRPRTIVAGENLVFGDASRFEVAIYAADGTLKKLVRRTHTPEPISREDLALWQAEVESKRRPVSASLPDLFRQPITDFELPETKAVYGDIQVDRAENIWVSEYTFAQRQPTSWSVFSPDGIWLGELTAPDRFRILDIGADYVLGVYRDELDVEYLQLYPLVR
jgi:hypothetical protein